MLPGYLYLYLHFTEEVLADMALWIVLQNSSIALSPSCNASVRDQSVEAPISTNLSLLNTEVEKHGMLFAATALNVRNMG